MDPAMNERDSRTGNIVIGATLVLTGAAIVADRAGVFQWRDQWTLWPLILGGIGLARFLQTLPGEPKQGLLFLTAAVWLLLSEMGLLSVEDSWPIIIIAFGLIVAFNGGRRRRWHMPEEACAPGDPAARLKRLRRPDRPLSSLAVLGIWIAIVVAVQVSGIRSFNADTVRSGSERIGIVSVMGRSEHVSRATPFQGANVTNVMGRSELDLSEAILAPGANATVHVVSMMGGVILRVPRTWTVDTGAISALGGVRDDRGTPPEVEVSADPAPRLVLRGLIMFGRLTITS
jgi:hypothetical protein